VEAAEGVLFQFLIGRLETSTGKIKIEIFVKFQFLIGRLETLHLEAC